VQALTVVRLERKMLILS